MQARHEAFDEVILRQFEKRAWKQVYQTSGYRQIWGLRWNWIGHR